jgi:hypothetical protein
MKVTLTMSMPRAIVLPDCATCLISGSSWSSPENANQHGRSRGCRVEYVKEKVITTFSGYGNPQVESPPKVDMFSVFVSQHVNVP